MKVGVDRKALLIYVDDMKKRLPIGIQICRNPRRQLLLCG